MSAVPDGIRIAVDARMIRAAGIGRYLRPIVRGLIADPRFDRIVLAGDPDEISAETGPAVNSGRVRILSWKGGPYSPRAHLSWPLWIAPRIGPVDVAFFPHFDVPLLSLPRRVVVTVHDLTHFVLPDLFPARKRVPAGYLLERAVARADRVLVGSESSLKHLVDRLPQAGDKVERFTYGFSDELSTEVTTAPPARVGGAYLLCVGNRKAHKNLELAVRILAALKDAQPDLLLVFAGGSARDGWPAVLRLAVELGVRDRIIDTGRVSDAELADLYRGCLALLLLSFNEGFGYPALEAMAHGVPVVAARAGALPEVVGDAGILVDPYDAAAAVSAIRHLIAERGHREALARKGPERAALFSEPQMVRRTLDVLVETAQGPRPGQPVGPRNS